MADHKGGAVAELVADHKGGAVAELVADPPAPPLTQRRPRVREVSSRFMSPIVPSNSVPINNELPRSKPVQQRRADENHAPDTNRSFDKSVGFAVSTVQRKQHPQRVKQHSKENDGSENVRVSSRPGTPIATGMDRVVPSRYRKVPNSINHSNSLNSSSNGCTAVSEAAKLLQETFGMENKLPKISTSSRDDSHSSRITASNQGSSSCPNSPLCVPITQLRSATVCSSVLDVDKWHTDRNSNSGKITSDCTRSLNFSSFVKTGGGIALPPHPSSCVKSVLDARKGRKIPNQPDDVHFLKMLSNHYLQWRFINAKAEASSYAQHKEAEKKLYSLGLKISSMRDDVRMKRNEFAVLRRIKVFTSVVEAQMPYLDEWSTVEEDCTTSLFGLTNALLSYSARLPINEEVQCDVEELNRALSSASKVLESIGSHIQIFMQKAADVDISTSELARMVGSESAHIEECGDLLAKTYKSQMEECSLRGNLIQLSHHTNEQQTL